MIEATNATTCNGVDAETRILLQTLNSTKRVLGANDLAAITLASNLENRHYTIIKSISENTNEILKGTRSFTLLTAIISMLDHQSKLQLQEVLAECNPPEEENKELPTAPTLSEYEIEQRQRREQVLQFGIQLGMGTILITPELSRCIDKVANPTTRAEFTELNATAEESWSRTMKILELHYQPLHTALTTPGEGKITIWNGETTNIGRLGTIFAATLRTYLTEQLDKIRTFLMCEVMARNGIQPTHKEDGKFSPTAVRQEVIEYQERRTAAPPARINGTASTLSTTTSHPTSPFERALTPSSTSNVRLFGPSTPTASQQSREQKGRTVFNPSMNQAHTTAPPEYGAQSNMSSQVTFQQPAAAATPQAAVTLGGLSALTADNFVLPPPLHQPPPPKQLNAPIRGASEDEAGNKENRSAGKRGRGGQSLPKPPAKQAKAKKPGGKGK